MLQIMTKVTKLTISFDFERKSVLFLPIERDVISLTNGITHPGAIMVEHVDTRVGGAAVL